MLEVDKRVRNYAVLLNDNKLIANLSTGNMIATEMLSWLVQQG